MSGHRVSVVLAAYNGGEFIEQQLESILSQSSPADELVVADDGSDDGTLDLVERRFVGRGLPDLIVLPPAETRGVSANFERAILASSGDLVALSDQDDIWVPDRLARQVEAFDRRPDLTLFHTDADLIDRAGGALGMTLFESLGVGEGTIATVHRGDAFDVLLRRNIVTGATVMFRRTLMTSAAPFPSEWVHDEWLAIIAAATGVVDVSGNRLIGYRQHGANQIGASDPSLWHRIGRMLEPRGDRNAGLASRGKVLADRLQSIGGVSDVSRELARGKSVYEARRAAWPSNRMLRAPRVLVELTRPDYARFSSQGRWDAARDLLQRP